MRGLIGVGVGCLLAVMIACGGAMKSPSAAPQMKPDAGGEPAGANRRAEIEALDKTITDDMTKLGVQRPVAPPEACTTNCAQAMAAQEGATQATPPSTCTPGKSEVCTDSCTLKKSICDAAGSICRIAKDLGGNDAYANGKCNDGVASCKAAETRCCSCI